MIIHLIVSSFFSAKSYKKMQYNKNNLILEQEIK